MKGGAKSGVKGGDPREMCITIEGWGIDTKKVGTSFDVPTKFVEI